MTMDAAALAGIVFDVRQWTGARVDRVFQPSASEVHLSLRRPGQAQRLCLGLRPDLPRLHFTAARPENPAHPPAFCMGLRKWLEGARLLRVEYPPWERWVGLHFAGRSSLGDEVELGLYAELIPGATNLVLVRLPNRQVLAALKPGTTSYQPPPPLSGPLPGQVSEEALAAGLQGKGPAWQCIVGTVRGFGPVLAREAVYRAGFDPGAPPRLVEPARLTRAVGGIAAEVAAGQFWPAAYCDGQGRPRLWHVLKLAHLPGHVAEAAETASAAADRFYTAHLEEAAFRSRLSALQGALASARKRLERKRLAQAADLQRAGAAGDFRLWAELLTAYADRVPPGTATASLPNYYLPGSPDVSIPLDPALNARANARVYFDRHAKAERTRRTATKELERTGAELEYLERVSETVEACRTVQDLGEVWEELGAAGFIRNPPGPAGTRAPKPDFTGLELVSSRGDRIMVGKNHRQNEQLVRVARPDDVWLHARGVPGAHVLLRPGSDQGREWPSRESLEEAAELAAHFSRAGKARWVEVDWTRARHVRRPRDARPGQVIYDHQQTVRVSSVPRLFPSRNPPAG